MRHMCPVMRTIRRARKGNLPYRRRPPKLAASLLQESCPAAEISRQQECPDRYIRIRMASTLSPSEEAQLAQTIEMFEVITQSQPHDYQSLEILKEAYSKLNREKDVINTVSYTHLRAHEPDSYLVCRL